MKPLQITGKIVCDLLRKFPDAPSLTIARIAYRDNVSVFLTVEHARSIVRYHRGNNGLFNKQRLKDKSAVRPNQRAGYNLWKK